MTYNLYSSYGHQYPNCNQHWYRPEYYSHPPQYPMWNQHWYGYPLQYPNWNQHWYGPQYINWAQLWYGPQYYCHLPQYPNWTQHWYEPRYPNYAPQHTNWTRNWNGHRYPDKVPHRPNFSTTANVSFVRPPANSNSHHNDTPKKKHLSKDEKSFEFPSSEQQQKVVRSISKQVNYKLTRPFAIEPSVCETESFLVDLFLPHSAVGIIVQPGKEAKINTHVIIKLPKGMIGLILDNSSVLMRKQLKVKWNVIDAEHRGDIYIILRNMSKDPVEIFPGEAIARMLLQMGKLNKAIDNQNCETGAKKTLERDEDGNADETESMQANQTIKRNDENNAEKTESMQGNQTTESDENGNLDEESNIDEIEIMKRHEGKAIAKCQIL